MIAVGAEFRDFVAERLLRFREILPGDGRDELLGFPVPPGAILLRSAEGRVLKVLHTVGGRLDPSLVGPDDLGDLGDLAAKLGARWVVATEQGAVEELMEEASGEAAIGADLPDLLLALIRAAVGQAQAGRLKIWPEIFEGVRLPSRESLDRTFDAVLPPRSSALLYVFDGPALFAEAIVVRGEREIELVAGHDALEMGPPPRRWREGYRDLLRAAESRLAKPSVAVFVSLEAVRAIATATRPGEAARALARRDLIIEPLPFWLAGPLGAAAVRDAVAVGRMAREQISERLDRTGVGGRLLKRGGKLAGRMAGQLGGAVADRLRKTAPVQMLESKVGDVRGQVGLDELLGFDPLILAQRLKELFS